MIHLRGSFLKKKDLNEFTDSYYEINIDADSSCLYCIGPIRAGDYIMTCPVYGTIMHSAVRDGAIGRSLDTKESYEPGGIHVIFFEPSDRL